MSEDFVSIAALRFLSASICFDTYRAIVGRKLVHCRMLCVARKSGVGIAEKRGGLRLERRALLITQ